MRNAIDIRPLRPSDSVEAITELLHRAYARNAAANLRFVATHQNAETTAKRLTEGSSFVAEIDGVIVGTITIRAPEEKPYGDYDPSYVIAAFGQFAVDPRHQGLGVGDALLAEAERVACEHGCRELALDTAQPATALVAYYEARGFRIVASADWRPVTNYESWIMSKLLPPPTMG